MTISPSECRNMGCNCVTFIQINYLVPCYSHITMLYIWMLFYVDITAIRITAFPVNANICIAFLVIIVVPRIIIACCQFLWTYLNSVRIFVLLKWTYPCSVHSYFLWTVLFLWKLMFLWILLFLWTIMLMWTLLFHWLLLFLWTHVDAYVSADAVVILNSIVPVNASVPLNAIVHVNPVIPVNASFLWTLVSQWTQ